MYRRRATRAAANPVSLKPPRRQFPSPASLCKRQKGESKVKRRVGAPCVACRDVRWAAARLQIFFSRGTGVRADRCAWIGTINLQLILLGQ